MALIERFGYAYARPDVPKKDESTKRLTARLRNGPGRSLVSKVPQTHRHLLDKAYGKSATAKRKRSNTPMTVDEFRKFIASVEKGQNVSFNFARQDLSIKAEINKANLVMKTDMDMIGGLIVVNDLDGNRHFFGVGDIMTIMILKKK